MKKIQRRAQPSRIAGVGRAIIGLGPGVTVLAGAGLLAAFIGLTLPIVLAVAPNAQAGDLGTEAASPLRDLDPATPLAFADKLHLVDEAIHDVLSKARVDSGGASDEVRSRRTVEGRAFDFTFREVAVPPDIAPATLRERIEARVVAPALGIDVVRTDFDSKTFQVLVVVETIPTHSLVLNRNREEDDSAQDAVTLAPPSPPDRLRTGRPKVAILIDDIGYRPQFEEAFLDLDAPLTFSVFPFAPEGAKFAQRAHALGREVMLHMPMEPLDYPKKSPGRGALMTTDAPEDVARGLAAAIDDVPFAEGVNNHMGSRFTRDQARVRVMLRVVRNRGLFFVDSLTHGDSVAYATARELGVPCAVRNVFLDHDPRFQVIAERIGKLVAIAQRNGFAVGIGHPHVATLEALKTYLPGLKGRGIDLVPVSDVVY
jgi:polysaccharide deacetylase 2 family uncharacterized protein YibQ